MREAAYAISGTLTSTTFTTSKPIISITPSWNADLPSTSTLTINLSADNGENWCVATNGIQITSGCGLGTGNQLRYKAIFASDGLTSPVLHDITIAYEIDIIPPESIFNLQSSTGTTWINWTWGKPSLRL